MNAVLTSNTLKMSPQYTIDGEHNNGDGDSCTFVNINMLELVGSLNDEAVENL